MDEYFRQASHLVLHYQWDEAIELLKKGRQKYPEDLELLLQLGTLLVRSGRLREGDRLLQQALTLHPHSHQVLGSAAEARLRLGQYSSALDLLQQSLSGGTAGGETHHRMAFALLAQGKEEAALEQARKAVELNPLDARFRRLYALMLETQNQNSQAYEQLELVSRMTPRDPHLLFHLSRKRLSAGQPLQAQEYLEVAVEIDPENPLYHDSLATLYQDLGEDERAALESQQAQGLRDAFDKYIVALGLAGRGRRNEAVDILRPVVQEHPEFSTGTMFLADLYQKIGKDDLALDLYSKILQRDPTSSTARQKSAWIQVDKGLFDSALALLEDTESDTPSRSLIAAYRGLAQEDWAEALHHLREFETRNPLNPNLLQLISYCLSAQGDDDEALRQLARAERLRPGAPEISQQQREIRLEKAVKFTSEGQWNQALNAFQTLMKEDVQPDYLSYVAYCRQQLGHLQRAVDDYRMGLEIDPSAHWARVNFAASLYRIGRHQEAADQWEIILRHAKTADSYYQLGLCYSHLNRFPEAESVFAKAVELGDERPQVLYNLGLARMQLNKLKQAWLLIRRAARSQYAPAKTLLQKAGQQ